MEVAHTNGPDPSASFLDELWDHLRQGARNVAGISFQTACTADLLVAGRVRLPGFPAVIGVVPEGLEDIDCDLAGGRRLLVQTKERGSRARPIGIADVAHAIAHAANALTLDGKTFDKGAAFALVTDGDLSGGIVETGWDTTLAAVLPSRAPDTLDSLIKAVANLLDELSIPSELASDLVNSTSVVRRPWHLAVHTEAALKDHLVSDSAVAWLVYGRLMVDLTEVAADQRSRGRQDSHRRTISDLDALITSVQETVDINGLTAAVRDGVVRPVDYMRRSSLARSDFLAGIDVTPAHVAADLDVVRVEELTAVVDGLAKSGQVVIAGPSGSGKSALLWRAGRDVGRGARPLQVLRCTSEDDVVQLVRHVRLQQPGTESPVLVCADDLGRDTLTAWPQARDQLVGIPGVILLATVRQEDFTARLAGSATVVDPRLADSSASEIYQQIVISGPPPRLEQEEAVPLADGLLMEFISLVTTGQRIRTVLRGQVEALSQSGRRLQRTCLRLVTAAHTMGSAVNADELGSHLASSYDVTADDVKDALHVLRGEHLLQPGLTGFWRGLHDLRTEVLVELLHESPPPTLAATYAEALPLLPPARRGDAIRRAAERVCAGLSRQGQGAEAALASFTVALRPVVAAAGRLLAETPADAQSASQATDLLDGSIRADAAAYAAATVPFLSEQLASNVDLYPLTFLAYAIRNANIQLPLPELAQLAARLPADAGALHSHLGSHIGTDWLVAAATAGPLPSAMLLLEAGEGAITLPADYVRRVWAHYVPAASSPPGEGLSTLVADHRARLAASLIALGEPGVSRTDLLGSVAERIAFAAASDPYALSTDLQIMKHEPGDDTHSQLIRRDTHAPGQILVCHARKLADPTGHTTTAGYPSTKPQTSEDGGINDQAIHLARRLLDIAPELDRADVDILAADLRVARIGDSEVGSKRLRQGVLQRPAQTRASVAFQAAVARLLAAGSWTERLRQQAIVASELVSLLEQLPLRLRTHDSSGRIREFLTRVSAAQTAALALPLRPLDWMTVDTPAVAVDHRQQDEQGRTKDRARDALGNVADSLKQIATGILAHDMAAVRGAGYRLADLSPEIAAARLEGAPTFARIGETLPGLLDDLCGLLSDLLLALDRFPRTQALLDRGGHSHPIETARRVIAQAAAEQERVDLEATRSWFARRDVPVQLQMIEDNDRPFGAVSRNQVLVAVPLDRWVEAVDALQHWPLDQRQDLSGAVLAVPIEPHHLLPMGVRLLGGGNSAFPVTEAAVLHTASTALGKPLMSSSAPMSGQIDDVLTSLVTASLDKVRDRNRSVDWVRPPSSAATPRTIAEELERKYPEHLTDTKKDGDPGTVAIATLIQLSLWVAEEDGREEGLAASVASIDWANLTESGTNPYVSAIDMILALGLLGPASSLN